MSRLYAMFTSRYQVMLCHLTFQVIGLNDCLHSPTPDYRFSLYTDSMLKGGIIYHCIFVESRGIHFCRALNCSFRLAWNYYTPQNQIPNSYSLCVCIQGVKFTQASFESLPSPSVQATLIQASQEVLADIHRPFFLELKRSLDKYEVW